MSPIKELKRVFLTVNGEMRIVKWKRGNSDCMFRIMWKSANTQKVSSDRKQSIQTNIKQFKISKIQYPLLKN